MTAKALLKSLSAAADSVVAPPPGLTVLIYHRVGGGSGSDVDLAPADFERQLQHLKEHHEVLPLDTAIARLQAGDTTAAVALTFDDGTADFTDVVVPLLQRYQVPATLYAATQFIDEGTDFPWGAPATSWAALRDAVSTGLVSVGSHTHGHWLLDRLAPAEVASDLDRSIELIGSEIGAAPLDFAYPKALPGSTAAEIEVRRRFRSAALARSAVNRPGIADVHRLWRTPVQRSDGFRFFAAKAAGGMRMEGAVRGLLSQVRYRGQRR
jgi:peptidoglycan/xylan/chitin deacetylase (PgdA/CDA1 family)